MNYKAITKPTLLINEDKCRSNIHLMVDKAIRSKVKFRPHFKTHQSIWVGDLFREIGVGSITVSSLEMAKYFVEKGWSDITVAFPVNIREYKTINSLAVKCNLKILICDLESVEFLDLHLSQKLRVYIKIDTGYHRAGVRDMNFLRKMVEKIDLSKYLILEGLLEHSGHSYYAQNIEGIIDIHNKTSQQLLEMRNVLKREELIISKGDTPTCSLVNDFSEIDEIRPGNFVFYDLFQQALGTCTQDQIAVCMACPVVSKNRSENELILYGGAIHFGKDHLLVNGSKVFGKLVWLEENGWSEIINEGIVIDLSQEHGKLKVNANTFHKVNVGDLVGVLPVHSCLTAQSMGGYLSLKNGYIDHFNNR